MKKGLASVFTLLFFSLFFISCTADKTPLISNCYLTLSGKIHMTLEYNKKTENFTDLYKVTVGKKGYGKNAGSYLSGEKIQITADLQAPEGFTPDACYDIYIKAYGPYIKAWGIYREDRTFEIIKEKVH